MCTCVRLSWACVAVFRCDCRRAVRWRVARVVYHCVLLYTVCGFSVRLFVLCVAMLLLVIGWYYMRWRVCLCCVPCASCRDALVCCCCAMRIVLAFGWDCRSVFVWRFMCGRRRARFCRGAPIVMLLRCCGDAIDMCRGVQRFAVLFLTMLLLLVV